MMRFLYTNDDGALCVVNAAAKSDLEKVLGPLTDDAYKEHVLTRSIPEGKLYVEIADSYTLPDREFRNAWMLEGKAVGHDLEKARKMQLDRIRAAREPKLVELDKEFMFALENSDDKKLLDVKAAKQLLRDITEPLKTMALNSIDDVKSAFPDLLK